MIRLCGKTAESSLSFMAAKGAATLSYQHHACAISVSHRCARCRAASRDQIWQMGSGCLSRCSKTVGPTNWRQRPARAGGVGPLGGRGTPNGRGLREPSEGSGYASNVGAAAVSLSASLPRCRLAVAYCDILVSSPTERSATVPSRG